MCLLLRGGDGRRRSRSFCAHSRNCCTRRRRANVSRSAVGMRSRWDISSTRSAWSIVPGGRRQRVGRRRWRRRHTSTGPTLSDGQRRVTPFHSAVTAGHRSDLHSRHVQRRDGLVHGRAFLGPGRGCGGKSIAAVLHVPTYGTASMTDYASIINNYATTNNITKQ